MSYMSFTSNTKMVTLTNQFSTDNKALEIFLPVNTLLLCIAKVMLSVVNFKLIFIAKLRQCEKLTWGFRPIMQKRRKQFS